MPVRRMGFPGRLIRPILGLAAIAAGAGVAVAVAATGSSTELGGTTTSFAVSINTPLVQASTAPGSSSYTTPDGVLTSWRYHSGPVGGTLRLVVLRSTGAPAAFRAVASSDTKTVAANTGNDFAERIPVKQGDVLGVGSQTVGNIGMSTVGPGDVMGALSADPQVGQTVTATAPITGREAIAATVESDADGDGFGDVSQDRCPTQSATHDACSNRFSFGGLTRNKDKGTATLPVTVPGPGTLSVSGAGVVGHRIARPAGPAGRAVLAAGTVKLLIKAKGRAKRKLDLTGRVIVKTKLTYTPTDGTPSVKRPKIKLVKR